MKELFCVGDRVVCVAAREEATAYHVGRCGVVKKELKDAGNFYYLGVEFDEDILDRGGMRIGHNLDGYIETSRGWYCCPGELELLQPETTCPVEDLL